MKSIKRVLNYLKFCQSLKSKDAINGRYQVIQKFPEKRVSFTEFRYVDRFFDPRVICREIRVESGGKNGRVVQIYTKLWSYLGVEELR